jgi:hypothetical protein
MQWFVDNHNQDKSDQMNLMNLAHIINFYKRTENTHQELT